MRKAPNQQAALEGPAGHGGAGTLTKSSLGRKRGPFESRYFGEDAVRVYVCVRAHNHA